MLGATGKASARPDHAVRLVLVECTPHKKTGGRKGGTAGPPSDGILRIATANMGRAIRSVSTEHGHDPADFVLFAFGGAGPLHASDVAAECGIRRILVPQEPGTLCARGILESKAGEALLGKAGRAATTRNWATVLKLHAAATAAGSS